MKDTLLEICVDSYESARRAAENGADRLELCANLILGGTSPGIRLVEKVTEDFSLPVNVLLRPRFGDFCYTREEKQILLEEIRDVLSRGAAGVVIGALTPQGELDTPFLERCMDAASGKSVTLHRCFDVCRDPAAALEQAVELGFATILTSGQESGAVKGMALLRTLQTQAAGRIHLMAGAGVTPENIPLIHKETGITHFHLSAKRTEPGPMGFRREGVPMGLPMASEFDRQYTDPAVVKAAAAAVRAIRCGVPPLAPRD